MSTKEQGWMPEYSRWRHGGWYVSNISYPSGACGCVSNNYPDKKWRIACDDRRKELGGQGDYTFPSRDAAARAELALVATISKVKDESLVLKETHDQSYKIASTVERTVEEVPLKIAPENKEDPMAAKQFSQREMESAVEIANIAGGYGYHTANSRDAMSQFVDWAVDFEKVPYIDDDWMGLIETFAEEKMLDEVRRGGAQFLGDCLPKSMAARLEDDQCQSDAFRKSRIDAEKIASEKGSYSHIDQKVDQSVSGKVMGSTDQHVVLSQGRSAVICKCGALDFVPIMGDEAIISFNGGWGTVSVVRERGQQGNER